MERELPKERRCRGRPASIQALPLSTNGRRITMRLPILVIPIVALSLGCGPLRNDNSANNSTRVTQAGPAAGGSDRSSISAEYTAAFREAVVCDPSKPDACAAQRPVPGSTPASVGNSDSMNDVPYIGFVNPDRTAPLDQILQRFTAAGCKIGGAAGPGPHMITCRENNSGRFTCDGWPG